MQFKKTMLNHKKRFNRLWAWTYKISSLTANNLNLPEHHITTSAQEKKRTKRKSRQPPWLPPRHFSPLLHQGAAHPPLPSTSATHSSPMTTAPCTSPLASHTSQLPQTGRIRWLCKLVLYPSPA
jgi:hypothetical protein